MSPDESTLPGLEFVDAAVAVANSLETGARNEIMSAAAVIYSTLGLLDDAIKSADEISDSYSRDITIAQVAVHAVASETTDNVLSLVESIEDLGNLNLALEDVAVKYAENNLLDTALEVSERLDDRDSTLARIVSITGKVNPIELSEELIKSIDDSNARTTCLIELANISKSGGHVDQAENFLLEAEAEVENQSVEDRIFQLIAIADVHEELGLREKAKENLLRAFKLCDEIEGPSASDLGKTFPRDDALVQLTGGFARSRYFDQADLAADQIENPIEFARAATQHAIERHKAGNDTQASQMLADAHELIASEPCYGERMLAVRDMACHELTLAYGTLQDFKKGLSAALLISNPEQQFTTLIELGRKAALSGLIDSVFEIQGALGHDYARVKYLVLVCDALLESGNKELAVRLLLRAIEGTDQIQRTDQRCLMLIQISSGLIAGGLESKANELVSTVLNLTLGLQDNHQQAQILVALAECSHRHGRQLTPDQKQLLAPLTFQ